MANRGKGARRRPNKGGGARTSAGARSAGASSAGATRAAAPSKQASPSKPASRPTREERQEALRRAHRRRVLRNRVLIALAVVVALAAVALFAGRGKKSATHVAAGLTSGSCRLDTESDPIDLAHPHVPNPSYAVDPPSGGNHLPVAAPAGTYTQANAPPEGQVVHAMEHGYVVFWYRPDLPAPERQKLFEAAQPVRSDVLVVPRPSLPVPVAATAWHHRLLCGQLEPSVLTRFARQYRNQGPEKIPHPAV